MEHLFQFFADIHPLILLSILLLFAALEYLFPPVPGDTVMLLASTLAGTQILPPTITLFLMIAGSCLGGILAYYLGYRFGRPLLNTFLFKYLGKRNSSRAERIFKNHAPWILCGNRFLPGVRGIMLPLAGILSYPLKHTVVMMVFSNIVWCTFIFVLGYWFGGNLETTARVFKSYNIILAAVISLFILTRLWFSYRSYSRSR